jgi:diacylglycerol kinase (ATP)
MKTATLLHNPKAGDEEHSKKELTELVEATGYQCRYFSTKKDGWTDFDSDVDLLIIAGGDGTVRKAVTELMKRKALDKAPPFAVLPVGTANNICNALNIKGSYEEIIKAFPQCKTQKFDVGMVNGEPNTTLFLEAFGFGLFPSFMNTVREEKIDKQETVEKEIESVLKAFHEYIFSFQPRKCSVEIDGTDYSGEYLMVEVMNVPSIGTNFRFAGKADISDGEFDVVLLTEKNKATAADYIVEKLKGKEAEVEFPTVKAKSISVAWDGTQAHVDDNLIKLTPFTEIKISVKQGLLRFLV